MTYLCILTLASYILLSCIDLILRQASRHQHSTHQITGSRMHCTLSCIFQFELCIFSSCIVAGPGLQLPSRFTEVPITIITTTKGQHTRPRRPTWTSKLQAIIDLDDFCRATTMALSRPSAHVFHTYYPEIHRFWHDGE